MKPINREKTRDGYRCKVYGCTFTDPRVCIGRAEKGDTSCQRCTGVRKSQKISNIEHCPQAEILIGGNRKTMREFSNTSIAAQRKYDRTIWTY